MNYSPKRSDVVLPVLVSETGSRPHFMFVLLRMEIICIKERNGKLLSHCLTHTRLTAAFDQIMISQSPCLRTIPDTPMTTNLMMNEDLVSYSKNN